MGEAGSTGQAESLDREAGTAKTCTRCHGLIVSAHAVDETGEIWSGVRCVICGDSQDDTILHHRSLPEPPEPKRGHATPVYRGHGS